MCPTTPERTPATRLSFFNFFPRESRNAVYLGVPLMVKLSTFGHLQRNSTVVPPITNSQTPENRGDLRFTSKSISSGLVLKISKVFRLGNRTKQSMNFVIKSSGG